MPVDEPGCRRWKTGSAAFSYALSIIV